MSEKEADTPDKLHSESSISQVQSLRELIEMVSGRSFSANVAPGDSGLAEVLPFPFLGLVGQEEMKLALLLSIINPLIGGVLLLGPRGTGKTTAVRSLVNLMPSVQRSNCFYGCLPEDIETGGIDAVCPECARKYGEGIPLTRLSPVRLVELPLNSRLEEVVGGIDEKAQGHERTHLRRGMLGLADLNVLYADEVNLLPDLIIDAILDAAAQGTYTIRREQLSAMYRSRFTLIGSMNPEEGNLRPQILDRFGLRVIVRGLLTTDERLEAYKRARSYRLNPRAAVLNYQEETFLAQREIQSARDLLPQVYVPDDVARLGIALVQELKIDSLRADVTLLEAARAYAAADARTLVSVKDLQVVAPLALRLRRSPFMIKYFEHQQDEETELKDILKRLDPHFSA